MFVLLKHLCVSELKKIHHGVLADVELLYALCQALFKAFIRKVI